MTSFFSVEIVMPADFRVFPDHIFLPDARRYDNADLASQPLTNRQLLHRMSQDRIDIRVHLICQMR
jgi:hypothetical protein